MDIGKKANARRGAGAGPQAGAWLLPPPPPPPPPACLLLPAPHLDDRGSEGVAGLLVRQKDGEGLLACGRAWERRVWERR